MSSADVKTLVLNYFTSWQIRDWELMERCLAPDFRFNSGTHQFDGAAAFLDMCRQGPDWESVDLLESVFTETHGVILYEGVSLLNRAKVRVSEIICCGDGAVQSVEVVFAVLP